MPIYLHCQKCRSRNSIRAQKCRKCGYEFPKKGKRYRVEVKYDGRRVTRVVENLTVAKEVEARIKGDFVKGEYGIYTKKKVPTLGYIWERYLPWAQQNKRTWKDDLRYYRRHIKPRFENKPLDKITPFDLEKMKVEMSKSVNRRGRPFAPQTIKHQLQIIRRLYNFASQMGLYDGSNPINQVKMPRVNNKIVRFLSEEELERLLDVLDNWPFRKSAAFVQFALFTGCRRGELFRLKWEDVNLEQAYITLRNPKGGKTKTIPISEQAVKVLKGLERTSEFVFPGRKGGQLTDFKNPWKRIKKAAGLPDNFRFHDLRHHFASSLVSAGVDLAIVRELLTHKNLEMTQRYAHLAPDVVRDAARKSGEILTRRKHSKLIKLR